MLLGSKYALAEVCNCISVCVMAATGQPKRTLYSAMCSWPNNDAAMQMPCRFFHSAWQFQFSLFSNLLSGIYGAPEEIRTPDPQIRSLVLSTSKRLPLPEGAVIALISPAQGPVHAGTWGLATSRRRNLLSARHLRSVVLCHACDFDEARDLTLLSVVTRNVHYGIFRMGI
jgi:hypothetical protein